MNVLDDCFYSAIPSVRIGSQLLEFDEPKIMGILNVTPDSFFDGGRYLKKDPIERRVAEIVEEGADIIDIGGYSSRPGATHISEKEELNRVLLCLEIVKKKFPDVIVSIDTFRKNVAEKVILDFKVDIINDISAGELDAGMLNVISKYNLAYVAMHMQGNPQNMQQKTQYKHVVIDVLKRMQKKILLLKEHGIDNVIIDPGFGFGKTLDQNYMMLSHLKMFNLLSKPILVGISRKSMLYNALSISPEQSLSATSIGHVYALMNGAHILRVHDVKEAKECVEIGKRLKTNHNSYS